MSVTDRDLRTLKLLARYYVMSRSQLTSLVYGDSDGRITRRRLQSLSRDGFIKQHNMQVVNPARGGAIPVYHLAERGREHLAIELRDDSYLLKPITVSQAMHLYHALMVTDLYVTIDAAIAKQDRVVLESSFNEHEIVNPREADPKNHTRLYIEISTGSTSVVCSPDLAIVLRVGDHCAAFQLEVETGKNGPRWAASRKHKAYHEYARQGFVRRHFPNSSLEKPFVLSVWPSPNFRDAFVRQLRGKEGAELWRVASMTEVNPDSFLSASIWYRVDAATPGPLVKS